MKLDAAARSLAREVVLSGRQETAFLVADMSVVRERVIQWREELPNIKPFFGIANGNTKPF